MENLPVFKTAWAANKQMLKMVFSRKGFCGFLLPLIIFYTAVNVVDFKAAYVEGEFDASAEGAVVEGVPLLEGEEEGVAMRFSESVAAVGGVPALLSILVGYVVSLFMAVRWHRFLIMDVPVGLSPKGLGKTTLKFIAKSVLIFMVVVGVISLLATVNTLSLAQFEALGGQPVSYLYLLAMFVAMLMAIYFFLKIAPGLSLVLPATAIGVKLSFKEAVAFMRPASVRLLVTLIVADIFVLVPFSLIAGVFVSPLLLAGDVYVVAVVFALLSTLSIFPTVSVLSMFFMHYVLPNIEHEGGSVGDVDED